MGCDPKVRKKVAGSEIDDVSSGINSTSGESSWNTHYNYRNLRKEIGRSRSYIPRAQKKTSRGTDLSTWRIPDPRRGNKLWWPAGAGRSSQSWAVFYRIDLVLDTRKKWLPFVLKRLMLLQYWSKILTGTRNTLNILKWELRLLSYFVDDRQLLELFSHLNVLLLDFSNSEHQFSIYPLFLAVKSIFLEKVSWSLLTSIYQWLLHQPGKALCTSVLLWTRAWFVPHLTLILLHYAIQHIDA